MPRIAKPKRKLTSRQLALIEQLADPKLKSNTQAAIAAGYSPKIARQQVCDSLALPHITQAVQKRIARARAFYHVEPEEIIGSTVFQMRSSMDDVLDVNGSFSITKARETGAIDLLAKGLRGAVDILKTAMTWVAKTAFDVITKTDWRKLGTDILNGLAGGLKALWDSQGKREKFDGFDARSCGGSCRFCDHLATINRAIDAPEEPSTPDFTPDHPYFV